jgi:isocitrate dehydrogenase
MFPFPSYLGRHAHGDQYKATDVVIPGNGVVKMVYTPTSGEVQEYTIFDFKDGGGVVMG